MYQKEAAPLIRDIKRIVKTAGKLQDEIHYALLGCAHQIKEHGNTTPLCMLVGTLPQGQRVESIKKWFTGYVPGDFRANTDPNVPLRFKLDDKFSRGQIDLEQMNTSRFYDKAESVPKDMTWDMLRNSLARFTKDKVKKADPALASFAADVIGKLAIAQASDPDAHKPEPVPPVMIPNMDQPELRVLHALAG